MQYMVKSLCFAEGDMKYKRCGLKPIKDFINRLRAPNENLKFGFIWSLKKISLIGYERQIKS
jgi:hypothetical protein